MCGLVAYIQQKKDQVPDQTLKDCLNQVNHRGPDSLGIHTSDLVGLGHHRLSIFDTSDAGAQPMSRDGCILIFNGAIYNYLELRAHLTDFNFTSQSDTEVIIAAYKEWGTDCVKKFNGQWSFVLYDTKLNIVFCSRDRYGIKPFYYLETDEVFWMSSEIKSFIPTGYDLKENKNTAADFLQHGIHNHTEETFFEEVLCLPPASNLVYDLYDHSYAIDTYYTPKTNINSLSLADSLEEFKTLFFDSLRYRLRSDVPLGVALSGGLDSASIACGVREIGVTPKSISAVFNDKDYSEETGINATASHANIENIKTTVEEHSILEVLHQIVWQHDQPVASMSVAAQYFNFQKAKESGFKVMLSGQGADETLMGYDAFLKVYTQQLSNPINLLKETINIAFKSPALIGKTLQSKNKNQNFLKSESHFAFPKYNDTKEQSLDLLQRTVLPALLHYEDRNSMAHGIESRVPYLDHNLVDYLLSVPQEYLIKKGVRKYLQRESLKSLLPQSLYDDHDKKPFISPQQLWMERNRKSYQSKIKELSPYIDHLVDMDKIPSIGSSTLFRILTYGLWRKAFFN